MNEFTFDDFELLRSTYNKFKGIKHLPFDISAPPQKITYSLGERLSDTDPEYAFYYFSLQILMQVFWKFYYTNFSKEFLLNQLDAQVKHKQFKYKLVTACLDNIPALKDKEIDDFMDFLDQIGESDDLLTIEGEIPFLDAESLAKIILKHYDSTLIKKWHILLAYCSYCYQYDSTETMQFLQILYTELYASHTIPDLILFLKSGILKANTILKNLDCEAFDYNSLGKSELLDGEFLLSPKFMTFMDGFIWFYHPCFPTGENGHLPYRYRSSQSRKVYSKIDNYLIDKLPLVLVRSKNGRIVEVLDEVALSDCIDIIEHPSKKPQVKHEIPKHQVIRSDFSKDEAMHAIKKFKSEYLSYLCKNQLDEYKVIYCVEKRLAESGAKEREEAFIFTVRSSKSKAILVFENINDNRSSYVVEVNENLYKQSIDSIIDFFESDIHNKRQKIAYGELKLSYSGIHRCSRIFHTDFQSWQIMINRFRNV